MSWVPGASGGPPEAPGRPAENPGAPSGGLPRPRGPDQQILKPILLQGPTRRPSRAPGVAASIAGTSRAKLGSGSTRRPGTLIAMTAAAGKEIGRIESNTCRIHNHGYRRSCPLAGTSHCLSLRGGFPPPRLPGLGGCRPPNNRRGNVKCLCRKLQCLLKRLRRH